MIKLIIVLLSISQTTPEPPTNREALARIISSEAIPSHYQDMLDVGTVVLNRLAKGKYGATVYSVVSRGHFDGFDSKLYQNPTKAHYRAADQLLNGYRSFGPDVLYYYNPNSAKDEDFIEWLQKQTRIKVNELKGTVFKHEYFKKS